MLAFSLLLAGCARLPKVSSGTAARDHFLTAYASAHGPTRGVASISVRRADQGHGSARVRWGANAESLAVVGYVGPARALDASLKGESLFIVIRRYGMGVAGPVRAEEGIDARILRFVATPWDFSPPWVRGALEHAAVRESGKGWVLEGGLGRSSDLRFTLEVSAQGEPVALALRGAGEDRERIRVRYGPSRNFHAGRIPGWIEWSFSGSVVLLKVEDLAPADASKIRYASQAEEGWTILGLDEPGGRSLVRWLLGLSDGRTEQ